MHRVGRVRWQLSDVTIGKGNGTSGKLMQTSQCEFIWTGTGECKSQENITMRFYGILTRVENKNQQLKSSFKLRFKSCVLLREFKSTFPANKQQNHKKYCFYLLFVYLMLSMRICFVFKSKNRPAQKLYIGRTWANRSTELNFFFTLHFSSAT